MPNGHMKRCPSHSSGKYKSKLQRILNLTPVRMAKITQETTGVGQGCGEKGTLLHCWGECKLVQPLWKIVQRFFRKLKIELPYDPAITLLGIYPKNMKTLIEKDMHPMLTAALFTIAKLWKQPKCPSTDEWKGTPGRLSQ